MTEGALIPRRGTFRWFDITLFAAVLELKLTATRVGVAVLVVPISALVGRAGSAICEGNFRWIPTRCCFRIAVLLGARLISAVIGALNASVGHK